MSSFQLQLADEKTPLNGNLKRRIVLTVDGKQEAIRRVMLDSDASVARVSNGWIKRHDIDADELRTQFDRLAMDATAESQRAKAERASKPPPSRRVSSLAAEWLTGSAVQPQWHRKGRTLYCQAVEREVPIGGLWALASTVEIDAVARTVEGDELRGKNGEPPDYRKRLGLWRDGVLMAAAKMISKLPEIDRTEGVDETIDAEELKSALVGWLLATRKFNNDTGAPISITYFDWASRLSVGSGWLRCHTAAVFARIDEGETRPIIAVKGETLASEMSRKSKRRLAADLRAAGLADTDFLLRVTDRIWRVWRLTDEVLDSVAKCNTEGALQ